MTKLAEPSCTVRETLWYDFPAYLLQNSFFSTIIVPTLGGKIVSLLDLNTKREWLWKNPDLPPAVFQEGVPYIRNLGGWDECFPSICESRFPAEPWANVLIPDHGEIWPLSWKTEIVQEKEEIKLTTSAKGVQLPYVFERSTQIASGSSVLSFDYAVQNQSDVPMPFIWSSHPTLAAFPGNKIALPLEEVTVFGSLDRHFGERGTPLQWPKIMDVKGKIWDFSILPELPFGTSVKLFSRKGAANYAILQDPLCGAEIRFDFRSDEITHLGIWLNFKGIGVVEGGPKYYCIAIEPCIGATDDLSLAYSKVDDHSVIPPNGRRTWNLKVRIGADKQLPDQKYE
jgi:galactose mutarotase-like enzyme